MTLVAQHLHFGHEDGPRFEDISLTLERGTLTCLLGPNGSGKSTLLRVLAGFLPVRSGSIHINTHDAAGLSRMQRAHHIAYVPQSAPVASIPVREVVLMGRTPHMHFIPTRKDLTAVDKALDYLELTPWKDRFLDEISGGERQKVLIARALAQETPILLLDEPVSSLDIRHQLEVYTLLQRLAHEEHKTILVTEHDLNLAAHHADSVLMLEKRTILACGTPPNVLTSSLLRQVYGVETYIHHAGTTVSIINMGLA